MIIYIILFLIILGIVIWGGVTQWRFIKGTGKEDYEKKDSSYKDHSKKLICRKYYFENCDLTIRATPSTVTQIGSKDMNRINNIKKHSLIGIQRSLLKSFIDYCKDHLKTKCIIHIIDDDKRALDISTGNQDISKDFLANPFIEKCYCETWIGDHHPKIQPMPIGVPSKYIDKIEKYLEKSFSKNFTDKPLKSSATFHHSLSPGIRASGLESERPDALKKLKTNPLVDFLPKMSQSDFFKHHQNYRFTISPSGNGIGVHRTWEAIFFQTIPIVKSGPLDYLYQYYDLPVAIISDWDQITEKLLQEFSKTLAPKLEKWKNLQIRDFMK